MLTEGASSAADPIKSFITWTKKNPFKFLTPLSQGFYNPGATGQSDQFSSVECLSHVQLFETSWTVAHQASLSITNSRSSLKLMSIELVMPSNHLIFYRPLSPPYFNLSQHKGLFKRVSSLHQVAKVLEFELQQQSFQWIFRTDFL